MSNIWPKYNHQPINGVKNEQKHGNYKSLLVKYRTENKSMEKLRFTDLYNSSESKFT